MWADRRLMAAGCTGGHKEALLLSPHPQSKTDQWDLIPETKNKPLPLAQGSRFPWATWGGSQSFLCQVLTKAMTTGYGKFYMRLEITEQNKKPGDMDLVTVISPVSYHTWQG